MRVHKKTTGIRLKKTMYSSPEETNFEIIYENVKNYLVFKISITRDIKDRMVYMDILDYMERVQLEANKIKKRGDK